MLLAALAVIHGVAQFVRIAEIERARVLRQQDDALLSYVLDRIHVICPDCRGVTDVTCLEEQMNTTWQCAACGCQFREFPHHTAKKGEL
jgi:hypothetical protein